MCFAVSKKVIIFASDKTNSMINLEDIEWRKYERYDTLGDGFSFKTPFVDGHLWFSIRDIGRIVGVESYSKLNKVEKTVLDSVDGSESITLGNFQSVRYYNLPTACAIMSQLGKTDEQFVLWAQAQNGEIPFGQYKDYVQQLKDADQEYIDNCHFTFLDKLWYIGEGLEGYGRLIGGCDLMMWYWLFFIIPIVVVLALPLLAEYVLVALVLFFLLFFIWYRLRFPKKRRMAILIHYGHPVMDQGWRGVFLYFFLPMVLSIPWMFLVFYVFHKL